MKNRLMMVLALSPLWLAACGGGDGAAPAPPPVATDAVPASALASPASLVSFVGLLPASETATPLEIDDQLAPPVSETDEPLLLG